MSDSDLKSVLKSSSSQNVTTRSRRRRKKVEESSKIVKEAVDEDDGRDNHGKKNAISHSKRITRNRAEKEMTELVEVSPEDFTMVSTVTTKTTSEDATAAKKKTSRSTATTRSTNTSGSRARSSRKKKTAKKTGDKTNTKNTLTNDLLDEGWKAFSPPTTTTTATWKKAIENFQKAIKDTNIDIPSALSISKKNTVDGLIECIIKASLSLSQQQQSEQQSQPDIYFIVEEEILLLRDNLTQLLNTCRKIIKQAKEETELSSEKESCLYVATHILRAATTCFQQNELVNFNSIHTKNMDYLAKQEATLRMYYHVIMTAFEVFVAPSSPSSTPSSSQPSSSSLKPSPKFHYLLSAYQGLGQLLLSYSIPLGTNSSIEFTTIISEVYSTSISNNSKENSKAIALVFPVPFISHQEKGRERRTRKGSKSGSKNSDIKNNTSISLEQISSIGIQSTLSFVRVLTNLWASCSRLCGSSGDKCNDIIGSDEHEDNTHTNSAFGNFVSHFTGEMRDKDESNNEFLFHAILHFTQNVALRWLLFMAINKNSESFTLEVLCHCKQLHRILWDAAATSSNNLPSSQYSKIPVLNAQCLHLRKHSILTLLMYGTTGGNGIGGETQILPHSMLSLLKEKYLQSASTYAWKAALSYVQQLSLVCPGSPDDPLHQPLYKFHTEVGAALDAREPSGKCLSYTEYCAYRAIHLGHPATTRFTCDANDQCLFTYLPFPYKHQGYTITKNKLSESSIFAVTLAMLYLSIAIRCNIQSFCENQELSSYEHNSSYCASIVKIFRSALVDKVVGKSDTESLQTLRQNCLRILMLVPLPSVLFQFCCKEESTNIYSNGRNSKGLTQILADSAIILSECLGPLAFAVLSDGSYDRKKVHTIWDYMLECFIRSASLLALLSNHNKDTDNVPRKLENIKGSESETLTCICKQSSKNVMNNLLSILLSWKNLNNASPPPRNCVEKVAKAFAIMGKKSVNKKQLSHSTSPLLCSLQLFVQMTVFHVEPKLSPYKTAQKFQLATRFSFLSSVFQSLGMIDKASTALLASLYVDVVLLENDNRQHKTNTEDSDSPFFIDILHFLGSRSCGTIVTCKSKLNKHIVNLSDGIKEKINCLVNMLFSISTNAATHNEQWRKNLRSSFHPILKLSLKEKLLFNPFAILPCIVDILLCSEQDNNEDKVMVGNSPPDLEREPTLTTFFENFYSGGTPFSFVGLLKTIFVVGLVETKCENLRSCRFLVYNRIKILTEILVQIGKKIQHYGIIKRETKGCIELWMEDYKSVHKIVMNLIENLLMPQHTGTSSADIIRVLFLVVTSTSLISYHPYFNCNEQEPSLSKKLDKQLKKGLTRILLTLANKFASDAYLVMSRKSIGEDHNEGHSKSSDEWSFMSSSIQVASKLFQLHLSDLLNICSSVDDDEDSLHLLLRRAIQDSILNIRETTQTSLQHNIVDVSQCCLIWSLSQYRDKLFSRGDYFATSQLAACMSQILKTSDVTNLQNQKEGEFPWFQASNMNLLLSCGPVGLDYNTIKHQKDRQNILLHDYLSTHFCHLDSADSEVDSQMKLAEIELCTCHLRKQILSSSTRDARDSLVETVKEVLGQLLGNLDSLQMAILEYQSKSETQYNLLAQWVKSSILLGLSEVAEYCSDLHKALVYLEQCYRICNEITQIKKHSDNLLASYGNNIPFWRRAALATVIIGTRQRQLDCLRRKALLHAHLGDYRKSEIYAVAAAKATCIDPSVMTLLQQNSSSSAKLKFFDYVSSLFIKSRHIDTYGSSQEMDNRHFLLGMKSLATAHDVVVTEFLKVVHPLDTKKLVNQLRPEALLSSSVVATRAKTSLNIDLDVIKCLTNAGDILYGSCCISAKDRTDFGKFYEEAFNLYRPFEARLQAGMMETLIVNPPASLKMQTLLEPLFSQLRLGKVRTLLEASCQSSVPSCSLSSEEEKSCKLCNDLANSFSSPKLCKAWAFYYLGLIHLRLAKRSGVLKKLWYGHSNVDIQESGHYNSDNDSDDECIEFARRQFLNSISLLGPATDLLTRMVLRSLVLVNGPEQNNNVDVMSSAVLLNTSIGCAARQYVVKTTKGKGYSTSINSKKSTDARKEMDGRSKDYHVGPRNEVFGTTEILQALDACFYDKIKRNQIVESFLKKLGDSIPSSWRFVAIALCPSGEILVNTLHKNASIDRDSNNESSPSSLFGGIKAETICIFPDQGKDEKLDLYSLDNYSAYNEILKPLDALIKENQTQLEGLNSTNAAMKFNEDDARKRTWWRERKKLDNKLRLLIEKVERKYFGSERVRQALLGGFDEEPEQQHSNSYSKGFSNDISCENLSSKFDAALNNYSSGKLSHRDLSGDEGRYVESKDETDPQPEERLEEPPGRSCTLLILDENLQRFPFEGMSCLMGQAVSRLPSLPFALAAITEVSVSSRSTMEDHRCNSIINPKNTSYILDPEGNLSETKHRLLQFIEDICTRRGWNWKGVVGRNPSAQFFEESLTKKNGLVLYCGHGGGQTCFSRSQVERLVTKQPEIATAGAKNPIPVQRLCRSSVILMGCSSGKLISVNRKDTSSLEKLPIFYEPEGIALSYLCAGAPCVVGNLWDVTDRDIDRYCLSLLELFLDPRKELQESPSLVQTVAEARSACKMQYIVGCAPVCYGIPVHLLVDSAMD